MQLHVYVLLIDGGNERLWIVAESLAEARALLDQDGYEPEDELEWCPDDDLFTIEDEDIEEKVTKTFREWATVKGHLCSTGC